MEQEVRFEDFVPAEQAFVSDSISISEAEKSQKRKKRKSFGRRVSFAPDNQLETMHLYQVKSVDHGNENLNPNLGYNNVEKPSEDRKIVEDCSFRRNKNSHGANGNDVDAHIDNHAVDLEYQKDTGNITDGIPSLAEILQSEGETDQLPEVLLQRQQISHSNQPDLKSDISIASELSANDDNILSPNINVISSPNLLDCEDGIDVTEKFNGFEDKPPYDSIDMSSSPQILEENDQINKWGFAPGEDDTQDLNMEFKGRMMMSDNTYNNIFGTTSSTNANFSENSLSISEKCSTPSKLDQLFYRVDNATNLLKSAIKNSVNSPVVKALRSPGKTLSLHSPLSPVIQQISFNSGTASAPILSCNSTFIKNPNNTIDVTPTSRKTNANIMHSLPHGTPGSFNNLSVNSPAKVKFNPETPLIDLDTPKSKTYSSDLKSNSNFAEIHGSANSLKRSRFSLDVAKRDLTACLIEEDGTDEILLDNFSKESPDMLGGSKTPTIHNSDAREMTIQLLEETSPHSDIKRRRIMWDDGPEVDTSVANPEEMLINSPHEAVPTSSGKNQTEKLLIDSTEMSTPIRPSFIESPLNLQRAIGTPNSRPVNYIKNTPSMQKVYSDEYVAIKNEDHSRPALTYPSPSISMKIKTPESRNAEQIEESKLSIIPSITNQNSIYNPRLRTPINSLRKKDRINLQEFLREVDIHFLDHMRRGASINLADLASDPPPHTLLDCYKLMSLTIPEIMQYEEGIAVLKSEISERKMGINDKELEISRQPPLIFDKIQHASMEEHEALKSGLHVLKQLCRLRTQLSWKEWRLCMEQQRNSSLKRRIQILRSDLLFLQNNKKYLMDLSNKLCEFVQAEKKNAASLVEARITEIARKKSILHLRSVLIDQQQTNHTRKDKKKILNDQLGNLQAKLAVLRASREEKNARLSELRSVIDERENVTKSNCLNITGDQLLLKVNYIDLLKGFCGWQMQSTKEGSDVVLVYRDTFFVHVQFSSNGERPSMANIKIVGNNFSQGGSGVVKQIAKVHGGNIEFGKRTWQVINISPIPAPQLFSAMQQYGKVFEKAHNNTVWIQQAPLQIPALTSLSFRDDSLVAKYTDEKSLSLYTVTIEQRADCDKASSNPIHFKTEEKPFMNCEIDSSISELVNNKQCIESMCALLSQKKFITHQSS